MTQPGPAPTGQTQPEGARVGDYRLIARIGEGGMGVVHLAQAADGRRVALKVLRQHIIGDEEARERLAREVNSLRRITSPRIAEVLDADPYGPTPFVATRYVPGLSLHEHVRQEGPIGGADLLHFATALAEALVAVHSVGVLHRDIKPSNVLMEGRSPVLIDFGLARLAEDPRLTHTGWLLGTPGYLAPEILYGDEATPASDVHAWAATVVYAATGRPPYGKGPSMAIMDRVRRGDHDLSAVPEPMQGLLRSALAPEPLDRPGLHEILTWLRGRQDQAAVSRPVRPAFDQWTMPVAALDRAPATEVRPTTSPPHDPRPATGPQQAAPSTRVLPAATDPGPMPGDAPGGSGAQRLGQLVGLGAVTSVLVAFAPYAGAVLIGLVILALRAVSIGRERHARRRQIRGRARWYDVPATTVSTPGYLVLAFVGALLQIGWAAAAAIAFGVLESLFKPPLPLGMVLLGIVFTAALWWGPGSAPVKQMADGRVSRFARGEFAGLLVIGLCVVATAVLLAALFGTGPNWTPWTNAPWSSGILADVARYL
ncbi:MAG: serine/threonine protein kinase [Actinomycetota bacterium]|nr:serine/threonine protein kinase [Actinomycetota bacterium]